MDETFYPYSICREYCYEFVSLGKDKAVRKLVAFTETGEENIFNLALFDILDSGECSNITETRNGDMITVLATIFRIVAAFLELNKEYVVVFRGNDSKRHRLYRIALTRELNHLSEKYAILGVTDDEIAHFQPNQSYKLYIISNKL